MASLKHSDKDIRKRGSAALLAWNDEPFETDEEEQRTGAPRASSRLRTQRVANYNESSSDETDSDHDEFEWTDVSNRVDSEAQKRALKSSSQEGRKLGNVDEGVEEPTDDSPDSVLSSPSSIQAGALETGRGEVRKKAKQNCAEAEVIDLVSDDESEEKREQPHNTHPMPKDRTKPSNNSKSGRSEAKKRRRRNGSDCSRQSRRSEEELSEPSAAYAPDPVVSATIQAPALQNGADASRKEKLTRKKPSEPEVVDLISDEETEMKQEPVLDEPRNKKKHRTAPAVSPPSTGSGRTTPQGSQGSSAFAEASGKSYSQIGMSSIGLELEQEELRWKAEMDALRHRAEMESFKRESAIKSLQQEKKRLQLELEVKKLRQQLAASLETEASVPRQVGPRSAAESPNGSLKNDEDYLTDPDDGY